MQCRSDTGGAVPVEIEKFNLDKDQISVKVEQSKVHEFEFVVENTGDINASVEISHNLRGMIEVISSLELGADESRTVVVNIVVDQNTTPDIYVGKIVVKTDDMEKEILVSVEVETPESLFDVLLSIDPEDNYILQGEKLNADISLTRLTGVEGDVTLNYVIKDENDNVVVESSETMSVADAESFLKEFEIPSDLEDGKYVLYTQVEYEGKVASASQWFNVGEEDWLRANLIWILLGGVLLVVGVVGGVVFLKKRG